MPNRNKRDRAEQDANVAKLQATRPMPTPTPAAATYERFTVETHQGNSNNRPYYSVQDNEAKRYRLPQRAVSLYFSESANAHRVAVILNSEWSMFLANPY